MALTLPRAMNTKSPALLACALIVALASILAVVWSIRLLRQSATASHVDLQEKLLPSTALRDNHHAAPSSRESKLPSLGILSAQASASSGFAVFLDATTGAPISSLTIRFAANDLFVVETTDDLGNMKLPHGDWRIAAWPAGIATFSSRTVSIDPTTPSIVWAFQQLTLDVQVVDDLGPIAGAQVEPGEAAFSLYADQTWDSLNYRVATDQSGRCKIQVPRGVVSRLRVSAPGYYPAQATIPSSILDKQTAMKVRLTRSKDDSHFSIQCLSRDQAPMSGIDVFIQPLQEDWIQAQHVYLGRTDSQGMLDVDAWATSAGQLFLRGACYPCKVTLPDVWPESGQLSITAPRRTSGHLVLTGQSTPTLNVSIVCEDTNGAIPDPFSNEVSVSEKVELTLPEAISCNVLVYDNVGGMWQKRMVEVESGWKVGVNLGQEEGKCQLVLREQDGEIGSIRATADAVCGSVELHMTRVDKDTVTVLAPQSVSHLSIKALDGRRCTLSKLGNTSGELDVFFGSALMDVRIEVVDVLGRPINDVIVGFSPIGRNTKKAAGWKSETTSSYETALDALGGATLRMQPGEYRINIGQLPWRESATFGWMPHEKTTLSVGADLGRNVIVSARPRRVEVSIDAGYELLPKRWTLWNSRRGEGSVFQGEYGEAWITDEATRLEVRSSTGQTLETLEIPDGDQFWKGTIIL